MGEGVGLPPFLPERAVVHFGMCCYFLKQLFNVRPDGVFFMALRYGVENRRKGYSTLVSDLLVSL